MSAEGETTEKVSNRKRKEEKRNKFRTVSLLYLFNKAS